MNYAPRLARIRNPSKLWCKCLSESNSNPASRKSTFQNKLICKNHTELDFFKNTVTIQYGYFHNLFSKFIEQNAFPTSLFAKKKWLKYTKKVIGWNTDHFKINEVYDKYLVYDLRWVRYFRPASRYLMYGYYNAACVFMYCSKLDGVDKVTNFWSIIICWILFAPTLQNGK